MARRRTSPLPSRLRDASESEDDLSHSPSSDDGSLMLDDEDPQTLLGNSQSGWSAFWSRFRSDPHAPKPIPLIQKPTRRQRRKERRAHRRARRRGGKLETESSTLYDADGASDTYRDNEDVAWSDEEYPSKSNSKDRRPRSRRCHRITLFILIGSMATAVLVLFLVQILKKKSPDTGRSPTAKPKTMYSNGTSNFGPTTILLSLDGFRADFLEPDKAPVMSEFVSLGISPPYMLPSFPSVTFPNHWTLVTGLHPESHGVIGNSFWDDELKEEFYYTDPARSMFPKWWASTGAEPLWATAERQGVRSAVHMWPGSEAGLQPEPFHIDEFNAHEDLSKKVRSVLNWIDLPSPFDTPGIDVDQSLKDPRPQFISMYVPNVDQDGHNFGPNTTEVHDAVKQVDAMVGDLLQGLEARNLTNIVNVIIVSDHGMATTSRQRLVQLEDLVDRADIEYIHGWPLFGLRPKAHVDVQKMYQDIKAKWSAAGPSPGWSVHTHQTMPERWHFTNNPRIAPIFIIPDAGWSIVTKEEMDLSDPANANAEYHPKGIHGYDNQHPLMRAIFVARGPAFPHPPGSRIKPFQNTEVYSIVCQSLNVIPNPNNSTLYLPLSVEVAHEHDNEQKPPSEDNVLPSQSQTVTYESVTPAATAPAHEQTSAVPGESEEPPTDHEPTDELAKAKDKLAGLWDKFRQGFGKLKGWLSDTFGGKKISQGG